MCQEPAIVVRPNGMLARVSIRRLRRLSFRTVLEAVKCLPLASYDAESKEWVVLRAGELIKLVNAWRERGEKVEVLPDANVVSAPANANEAVLRDLCEFQKEGVKFLWCHKAVVLGDEPGLGKTVQVLVAAQPFILRGAKLLVFCPSLLVQKWAEETEKWLWLRRHEDVVIMSGSKSKAVDRAKVVLVPFLLLTNRSTKTQITEMAKAFSNREVICVVDDFHILRDRSGLIERLLWFIQEAKPVRLWLVSGTPCGNGTPSELWVLFKLVNGKAAERLRHKFWHGMVVPHTWVMPLEDRRAYMEALQKVMLRRTATEAGLRLPSVRVGIYVVPLPQPQELKELLESVGVQETDFLLHGVEHATYRRALGVWKAGKAIGHIEELAKKAEKLCVICVHREVARKVAAKLKERFGSCRVWLVHGGQGLAEREMELNRAKRAEAGVLVATVGSVGKGLDLDFVRQVVLLEWPHSSVGFAQTLARFRRFTSTQNEVTVEVVAVETEEEAELYSLSEELEATAEEASLSMEASKALEKALEKKLLGGAV